MLEKSFFLTLLFAILGWTATFFSIKWFPKWNLLDFPERYGLKRAKIPYPGGISLSIIMIFGFVLITKAYVLSFLLLITAFFGFLDDKWQIPAHFRLLFQITIVFFAFQNGISVEYFTNPFANTNISLQDAPFWSFMVTFIWILLLQNAMNFLDGLAGLSVGVSGIGFATIGLLGLIKPELLLDANHQSVTFTAFSLCGVCMGAYMLYAKEKIILGDAGSQTLGLFLGIISLISGAKLATTLLVLGIPIIDAIITIFRRIILENKAPWHGDDRHLHHLLVKQTNKTTARRIILFLSLIFALIALFLNPISKLWGIIGMTTVISAMWAKIYKNQQINTKK